jgi:hypothetical protein
MRIKINPLKKYGYKANSQGTSTEKRLVFVFVRLIRRKPKPSNYDPPAREKKTQLHWQLISAKENLLVRTLFLTGG